MTDKTQKTVQAYDKNPQFYADMFDDYGVRAEDVERALKLNMSRSNRVLELGCGNGRDALYIISKVGVNNYEGVDASEGLISLARQKVSCDTFFVGDMRDLEVSPETFGVIFSFASMLHLKRDDLAILIGKCYKSLKTGGILYIFTKYGEYKEIEVENLGEKKYYYAYTPDDIKAMAGGSLAVVYSVIGDSDYGPALTIALRKL
jgi:SAM-dependent methyltransferase